jgi:hypothetical protein
MKDFLNDLALWIPVLLLWIVMGLVISSGILALFSHVAEYLNLKIG